MLPYERLLRAITPYLCHFEECSDIVLRQTYAMTFQVMEIKTETPRYPVLSLHVLKGPVS